MALAIISDLSPNSMAVAHTCLAIANLIRLKGSYRCCLFGRRVGDRKVLSAKESFFNMAAPSSMSRSIGMFVGSVK